MATYVKSLTFDINGNPLQEYPQAYPALQSWEKDNAVVSSIINLNPNTTVIEVGAYSGQGAVIRWVPLTETAGVAPAGSVIASGASANFTHQIPAGTVRRFVIPKETQGQTAGGQIGSVNGLYQRLAWINAGSTASSILASEF
jgi:hypothetical protein